MKIGIIGAGGIAGTMAATVAEMKDVENYAIASRDADKSAAFAGKYGMTRHYGSYEALLEDPVVDLVYIALPHSHHRDWTIKSLEAGKNVLCEKAFAVNEAEAREMIELSEKKGLLLAEAIWTRYMPSRNIIREVLDSGRIGSCVTLSANLGYRIDKHERIIRPELAGGALLDLTVYPLNFASMVWGDDIKRISASCVMTSTGVDGQDNVMLEYGDGRMASLFTTIYALTDRKGLVAGTEGFLEVDNINNPQEARIYSSDRKSPELLERIAMPKQISGYEYEVISCMKAIQEGLTECPEMPHAQTLEIMRQMDEIKRQFMTQDV